MPCFYCGKRISMVRQMTDQDFCSDEHRRRYQDLAQTMLARLAETDPRPAARAGRDASHPSGASSGAAAAAAPAPAPAHKPKPKPKAPEPKVKIIVPPERDALPGVLPRVSAIVGSFLSEPVGGGFVPALSGVPEIGVRFKTHGSPDPFDLLPAQFPMQAFGAALDCRSDAFAAFESREAAYGSFAPGRQFTLGARPMGFFAIEPGPRRRFARHRSALAPRMVSHAPVIPALAVQFRFGSAEPATFGAMPAEQTALTPAAGATKSCGFEMFAAQTLHLAARPAQQRSKADAIEALASGGLCGWQIEMPAARTLPAAAWTPAGVTPSPRRPVFPDASLLNRIQAIIGPAGYLTVVAGKASVPPHAASRPAVPLDVWSLETPGAPVLSGGRFGLAAVPPSAGAIRRDPPGLIAGTQSRFVVSAPPLAKWGLRQPASAEDNGVAAIRSIGFFGQPKPAARAPRQATSPELLTPPILTVAAVVPELTAERTVRSGREPFGFRPGAAVAPVCGEMARMLPAELLWRRLAHTLPVLSVAANRRSVPQGTWVTPPAQAIRQLRCVPLAAAAEIEPSIVHTTVRRVRPVYRALPQEPALGIPVRPMSITGSGLPAGEPAAEQRAVRLPYFTAGAIATVPPAVPAYAPRLTLQVVPASSRSHGFIEPSFRPAPPPAFHEEYGAAAMRATPFMQFGTVMLHGLVSPEARPQAAPALAGPSVRFAASPEPPPLAKHVPVPGLTPIHEAPPPAVIASQIRPAPDASFTPGPALVSRKVCPAARTIGHAGLLPFGAKAVSARSTAIAAPALIPSGTTQLPERLRAWAFSGLRAAGFLSGSVQPVKARGHSGSEEWALPETRDVELASATTQPAVKPRLTPARAVMANIRLTAALRSGDSVPAAGDPVGAPTVRMPVTATSAEPGIAPVALFREALPGVRTDSRVAQPAFCTLNLRGPAAMKVVRRAVPMRHPGYPLFPFAEFEVMDFDDDDTCILNGPVEPDPLAPAWPQRRIAVRAPRALPWCGLLMRDIQAEAGNRRPVPDEQPVAFALAPDLPGTPDEIAPLVQEENYRVAAGEGLQPRTGWRGATRLFR